MPIPARTSLKLGVSSAAGLLWFVDMVPQEAEQKVNTAAATRDRRDFKIEANRRTYEPLLKLIN